MDEAILAVAGDPGWIRAHADLLDLHNEKSSTYGTGEDRLANFTKLGEAAGQPPERYAVERLIEKAIRALHMIDAGEAHAVKEYPDLASLALCAEALRLRKLGFTYSGKEWADHLDIPPHEPRCIP
jgi:hypothetical protein